LGFKVLVLKLLHQRVSTNREWRFYPFIEVNHTAHATGLRQPCNTCQIDVKTW